MSLSLLCLYTEIVTVMRMVHLNETALGNAESLSSCAVCLNLSHDRAPFKLLNFPDLSDKAGLPGQTDF